MIFNSQIPPYYKQKYSCEHERLLAHVTMLTGTNSTQLEAQERLFLACKLKNSGSFHTVWRRYIWFDPLEGTASDPAAQKAEKRIELHLVRPVRGYCKILAGRVSLWIGCC